MLSDEELRTEIERSRQWDSTTLGTLDDLTDAALQHLFFGIGPELPNEQQKRSKDVLDLYINTIRRLVGLNPQHHEDQVDKFLRGKGWKKPVVIARGSLKNLYNEYVARGSVNPIYEIQNLALKAYLNGRIDERELTAVVYGVSLPGYEERSRQVVANMLDVSSTMVQRLEGRVSLKLRTIYRVGF